MLASLVLLACSCFAAAAGAVGTSRTPFPSQREIYADPLTGREVWRMTTTGRDFGCKNDYVYYTVNMWSPDGRYLLFNRSGRAGITLPDGRKGILDGGAYVMNADGTGIRKVFSRQRFGWKSRMAVWGPGYEIITFSMKESGGTGPGVIAIDIDTGKTRQVSTLPATAGTITVNSDGTLVVWSDDRSPVYWAYLEGSGVRDPRRRGIVAEKGCDDNTFSRKRACRLFSGATRVFEFDAEKRSWRLVNRPEMIQGHCHYSYFPNDRWVLSQNSKGPFRHGHDRWAIWDLFAGRVVKNLPMENCIGYEFNGDGGSHVNVLQHEDRPLVVLEDRANRRDQHGEPKGTRPCILVIDASLGPGDRKYLDVICKHYSSSTDLKGKQRQWAHPHAHWSPDGTKIGYNSNMHWAPSDGRLAAEFKKRGYEMDNSRIEHADIFVAVYRKPDTPRKLQVDSAGDALVVSWLPGRNHRETRGYLVYRAEEGGDFKTITPQPVSELRYRDASVKPRVTYTYGVRAREWSGLVSPPAESEPVDLGVAR